MDTATTRNSEGNTNQESLTKQMEGLNVGESSGGGSSLSYAAVASKASAAGNESDAKAKENDASPEKPIQDVVKNSTLSVEAAEFVPRYMLTSAPTASPPTSPSAASTSDFGKLDPAKASEIRAVADKIVKSPNCADEYLQPLITVLRDEASQEARTDGLRGFTGIIVEKAATDYGARHAMGRMINVLLESFDAKENKNLGAEFWEALNDQLTKEHKNAAATLAKNPARYKTFAFFLAEVLGTSSRMFGHQKANELSDLVLAVLEDFFITEDGEQWKIAGQVLKQVGAYIEDNFAKRKDSTGQSDMDRFMCRIDARGHSGREDIPFYIRSMLINIMELRAYNWGRSCVPGDAAAPAPPTAVNDAAPVAVNFHNNGGGGSGEPIGHEIGMALNSEERQFLENEGVFDDEVHEDYDTGMDEEMEKDYELFLQMNANGQ